MSFTNDIQLTVKNIKRAADALLSVQGLPEHTHRALIEVYTDTLTNLINRLTDEVYKEDTIEKS